jgi:hypothetical protein
LPAHKQAERLHYLALGHGLHGVDLVNGVCMMIRTSFGPKPGFPTGGGILPECRFSTKKLDLELDRCPMS